MTTIQERKRKARNKALMFGVVSVALYASVFSYADTLVHMFAKGGMYTLLPVATVFVFSYVHGTFAGNFWSALGIEASHKAGKKVQKSDATRKTPAARPQARVSA
ncbi:MAG: hypothetical protein AB7E47_05080 [Desulfovibrionaceae bacterium]